MGKGYSEERKWNDMLWYWAQSEYAWHLVKRLDMLFNKDLQGENAISHILAVKRWLLQELHCWQAVRALLEGRTLMQVGGWDGLSLQLVRVYRTRWSV